MGDPELDRSPDSEPDARRAVPRGLLALREKANGAELDGKGIQAWLEWEMEAMLWGVPVEISGADLEKLVEVPEALLERVDGAPGSQAVSVHHDREAGSREGSR